ncbi:MAG: hypothetical protein IJV89_06415 [Lentisphaeria bacterium]|nr:hypothetical protein [Lentisphaeria bacterium]
MKYDDMNTMEILDENNIQTTARNIAQEVTGKIIRDDNLKKQIADQLQKKAYELRFHPFLTEEHYQKEILAKSAPYLSRILKSAVKEKLEEENQNWDSSWHRYQQNLSALIEKKINGPACSSNPSVNMQVKSTVSITEISFKINPVFNLKEILIPNFLEIIFPPLKIFGKIKIVIDIIKNATYDQFRQHYARMFEEAVRKRFSEQGFYDNIQEMLYNEFLSLFKKIKDVIEKQKTHPDTASLLQKINALMPSDDADKEIPTTETSIAQKITDATQNLSKSLLEKIPDNVKETTEKIKDKGICMLKKPASLKNSLLGSYSKKEK